MLLAVDIGNTNITVGAFSDEKLIFTLRLATDHKRLSDQYAVELRDMLDINGAKPESFYGAIISSVVPALTGCFKDAVKKITGLDALIVGPGIKTGLNIRIDNPAQLGADLVAVSVAAVEHYPLPNIVCDLGTATTFSVVDKNANMIGGLIIPGVKTGMYALVSNTSLLYQIDFEKPKRVIGRSTSECMQSGLIFGAASMLDGLIDRIEEELGETATVIATGGLSNDIIPCCKHKIKLDANLILEGLRLIYLRNVK